ncbi:hypothetical protein AAFF_G00117450 [Aldrovandia affinis]|uniref:Uncharacterized protein n=1 Tax=Aldrovandia affinis TaxID=143900 RepID=A0AAD7T1Q2_9TELE|nr:hypothetical protein AAFF_G00117450 [Aldrovandia affinis]
MPVFTAVPEAVPEMKQSGVCRYQRGGREIVSPRSVVSAAGRAGGNGKVQPTTESAVPSWCTSAIKHRFTVPLHEAIAACLS